MKKKGFTLVEIIAVIGILAVIGTASFFGIRLVSKNIRITKLEQITDRVLQAAEVYIETNKETKTELYNNKNSVVIPLNALINEGLMDLKGTTLEDKDIENEYVVSAFTSKSAKENCVDITTSTSWNLSKENPFYICSNESGTSNSIIIGGTTNNADRVKKTLTTPGAERNYVTYKDKTYRLLYIETDDSLVIYTSEDTFGDVIKDKTQPILMSEAPKSEKKWELAKDNGYYEDEDAYMILKKEFDKEIELIGKSTSSHGNYDFSKSEEEKYNEIKQKLIQNNDSLIFSENLENNSGLELEISSETGRFRAILYVGGDNILSRKMNEKNKKNNEVFVQFMDYTSYSGISLENVYIVRPYICGWTCPSYLYGGMDYTLVSYPKGVKANLKPCVKIASGTGTSANPYRLDDSSC